MPNNQLITDLSTTLDYEAGETVEVELPRTHYFERLNLLLDWTLTSDGTGNGSGPTADTAAGNGVLDLVDRIELEFDGSKTLKSTDLAMSHYADWFDYGSRPLYDALDHSSASQQSGQVQTFMDFLLAPGSYGALLPAFAFSDLVLRVKWGTASDVGSDVSSVDSASISVQTKQRRKRTVANPPEVTTKDVVNRLLSYKERQRNIPLTVDGVETIDLNPGNTFYGIAVQVLDDDTPDNALVDGIEIVENNVDTHKSSTYDLVRAKDAQEYGLESQPDGFFMLDYGFRGNTDDVVATRGMDAYELTLETTGAPTDPAEARVVTREIVS